MTIRFFALFLAIYAAAARADVVVGSGAFSTARLYYMEGGAIVRATCERGAAVFDHDTCHTDRQRATHGVFLTTYRGKLGAHLEEFELRLAQTWSRLQTIDLRLLEMLHDDVPAEEGPTLAELDAKLRELNEQQAVTQSHRDQMARLREALELRPGDAEVLAQLELTRASLARSMEQENTLRTALVELRERYFRANEAGQSQDYQDLSAMHAQALNDVEYWRREVNEEIEDLARGETWLRRLEDGSLPWMAPGNDPYEMIRRFEAAFTVAEPESRTVYFRAGGTGPGGRYRVIFQLDDQRPVEDLRCRVSSPRVAQAQFRFRRTRSSVVLAEAVYAYGNLSAGTVALDTTSSRIQREALVEGGILGVPAASEWDIGFYLLSEPMGPAPEPFEHLTCALVYAR